MNIIKLSLAAILLLVAGYIFFFCVSAVTIKILIAGLLILNSLLLLIDALAVYAGEWIKTFLILIMAILVAWYFGGFTFEKFSPIGFLLAVIIIIFLRHPNWFTDLKDKRYRIIKKVLGGIVALMFLFSIIYLTYEAIKAVIDIIQGRW